MVTDGQLAQFSIYWAHEVGSENVFVPYIALDGHAQGNTKEA